MTTIAYSAGMLAADRQINSGNTRFGFARKIAQGPLGHMGGSSGSLEDLACFCEWITSGCVGAAPTAEHPPADGLVIFPDGRIFHWAGTGRITEFENIWAAAGSGEVIALTAMRMGATAKEAVEMAIDIDTSSGGDVDVLYLPGATPPQSATKTRGRRK